MRIIRRDAGSKMPQWAADGGEKRDHTALHLSGAVTIGLLFAGSLTLFGGPLTDGLKALGAPPPAQAQPLDPARF